MTKLEKLYSTISNLEELELPVSPELLLEADKLEEKIITEEILPLISEKIEPLLKEIQRDLVLVVEHHHNEPIKVALSRRMKISEIADAKQFVIKSGKVSIPVSSPAVSVPVAPHTPTKQVVNHTKGLCVTFPDGTIICHTTAIETLVATLQKIGFNKAAAVGIRHGKGYNLIDKNQRPLENGRTWQHECDGWYIYSNTNNKQKCGDLQKISDQYDLGLKIEELKGK